MDGLSLFVGGLIGWLVEWLIDIFYWRRNYARRAINQAALTGELSTANSELERLRARIVQYEAGAKKLNAEIVAAKAEIDAAQAELADARANQPVVVDQLDADLAAAQEDHTASQAISAPPEMAETTVPVVEEMPADSPISMTDAEDTEAKARQEDDLTLIEGIGPKISALLKQNGIFTFEQLSRTSPDHLQTILNEGGSAFRLASPQTWPERAQIAAAGDQEEPTL